MIKSCFLTLNHSGKAQRREAALNFRSLYLDLKRFVFSESSSKAWKAELRGRAGSSCGGPSTNETALGDHVVVVFNIGPPQLATWNMAGWNSLSDTFPTGKTEAT